jgi:hypothetical protein
MFKIDISKLSSGIKKPNNVYKPERLILVRNFSKATGIFEKNS